MQFKTCGNSFCYSTHTHVCNANRHHHLHRHHHHHRLNVHLRRKWMSSDDDTIDQSTLAIMFVSNGQRQNAFFIKPLHDLSTPALFPSSHSLSPLSTFLFLSTSNCSRYCKTMVIILNTSIYKLMTSTYGINNMPFTLLRGSCLKKLQCTFAPCKCCIILCCFNLFRGISHMMCCLWFILYLRFKNTKNSILIAF